ncbi:MAG: hypothetical protein RIC52_14505 [Amphiplicatus sp.]
MKIRADNYPENHANPGAEFALEQCRPEDDAQRKGQDKSAEEFL